MKLTSSLDGMSKLGQSDKSIVITISFPEKTSQVLCLVCLLQTHHPLHHLLHSDTTIAICVDMLYQLPGIIEK